MWFPQVLLAATMLATSVFSVPITMKSANKTDAFKFANSSKFTENYKPVVITVEEKNPNSGSLVLEFVYNGHSVSDKDKYVVDAKNINNKQPAFKGKVTNKLIENPKDKQLNTTEVKKQTSVIKTQESTETMKSLLSEEGSLVPKYPKYFNDAFNPVPPFPEQYYGSLREMLVSKSVIPELTLSYEPEQKKFPDTAVPRLGPISIYDREFRLPAFV